MFFYHKKLCPDKTMMGVFCWTSSVLFTCAPTVATPLLKILSVCQNKSANDVSTKTSKNSLIIWLLTGQILLLLQCCQKRATTLMSRSPAPPEPAPEPWAEWEHWSTWMWWRPLLKLAHSKLVESLGARETSGPAPSNDNVPKQTEKFTGKKTTVKHKLKP